MIEIKNLTHSYNGLKIFDDLSLTINDGEIVGIIGPSGTGKSTLLKSIISLITPNKGEILLNGKPIKQKGKNDFCGKVGMVFQNFNLFNHLSVIENVMAGPIDVNKKDKTTAYNKAMELLRFVGLSDRALSMPKELSGGQQQRVAIARTLALNPEIILMDEPTSSLDPLSKGEVETVIQMLADQKRTMIIVSHEMELIRNVCKRVVFLSDGKVCEEGSIGEIFDNPKNDKTRRFIKALRLLEMEITSSDFDFIGLQTTYTEYAYKTGMPQSLLYKLQSVMEEFFHVIIIDNKENNVMKVLLEYDYKTKTINGKIYCSGEKIDTDNPIHFMSWAILTKRCKNLTIEDVKEEQYTNLIKFDLE